MINMPYEPPSVLSNAYNCPHCHAYASVLAAAVRFTPMNVDLAPFKIHRCSRCGKFTLWHEITMIHPPALTSPPPNADMPVTVLADYEEARGIAARSPRGAAALLRPVIQKLCTHLGVDGGNLNAAIGELVRKGLPARVQQALDVVRVVGNKAVHPGQIDLKDDVETANALFGLVNVVAEVMITQPKVIETLYGALPEGAKEAIERRDRETP
ncbi:MAG: DUF4145 domain-containing protein [Vicinamibacteria bacterium]|nr:DUF4145 domain-containing protein [Vicinamibacteria bacterium]